VRSTLLPILAALAVPSFAQAQTFEVPGDYADLQVALDAVPAGATILVHGGNWETLRIEKPVTLVGDSFATLWGGGDGPENTAPITLDGPGAGSVVLRSLSIGAGAYSPFYSTTEPAIQGGGFDALFVHDSQVDAPIWQFVYNTIRPGGDAIRTTVPLLWIEESTVRGGDTVADQTDEHTQGFHAGHGIIASGTVVLIDSNVQGGRGEFTIVHQDPACGGACPDGDGGNGIECDVLLRAGSSVSGGFPSSWQDPTGNVCCVGSPGIAIVANSVSTIPTASVTSRTAGTNVASYSATAPVLGEVWTATVDLTTTGHCFAQVRFHTAPASIPLASGAFLLLGGALLGRSPLLPGPVAQYAANLPADPSLSGLTVFSQAAHFGGVVPYTLTNALDLTLGTD